MTMVAPTYVETELVERTRGKRLLVLDYDGTLAYLAVDWPSVRRDLSHVAARLGFASEFRPLFVEMARFRDECGAESLPVLFRALQRHEDIGVDGQRPREEVIAAVRAAVRENEVSLVVFSVNLHGTIEAGLRAIGLPSVSGIVGADDVEHWKPHPEGLNRLLQRAGVAPEHALFVGDGSRDHEAALAAGVEFFGV